ncbi:MAG TPA: glycosyltransferase family 2 protein, partial [Acetobacteraceae bacterium]
ENWAAVIVDDGSTDDTAALVAGCRDPRLCLVRQDNAGVSAARNRGVVELPAGDALLFLDADDWLAPDALARLVQALDASPTAVAAAGPCAFMSGDADSGDRPHRIKRPSAGDLFPILLERNVFANGGHLLIRSTAADRAGRFRTDLTFGEDWEYWTRLAALGTIAAVGGRPVLFVRERRDGAYLRQALDPGSFLCCIAAIFENPTIIQRYGRERAQQLRSRALAETMWVFGRALVRQGHHRSGLHALRGSVARKPSVKRLGLLTVAHLREFCRLPQA